jgi:hypothetical protein
MVAVLCRQGHGFLSLANIFMPENIIASHAVKEASRWVTISLFSAWEAGIDSIRKAE